jgi:surfactin family lipopeptide synthetase A
MARSQEISSEGTRTPTPVGPDTPSRPQLPLPEWNQTQVPFPQDVCIHDLFERQATRTPDAIALQFQNQHLTYSQLSQRSNQLANKLAKNGVGPEVLVGICMDRSLEMIVGMLGILKAGGAYVPLDPSYPKDRIQYVLEDSGARVVVGQPDLARVVSAAHVQFIPLDSTWKAISSENTAASSFFATPRNLAYVIYTSGSTGRPKGVQIEHRSVVNFLLSMQREPGLTSADRLLAVTTLSFDIAGLEVYLPLSVGAQVAIADRNATCDGNALAKLLEKHRISVMQATPATWRLLLESGWKGSRNVKALVGGEAVSPQLARDLQRRCASVWNMYGPTETTIWSSICQLNGSDDRTVPIGRPIANTTFYILDESRRPVDIGCEGELYIGGAGLARGYWRRPELSADKFVPDCFSTEADARLYRTGDLARYRNDGAVEFLGRIDNQVKVRGFRIELGEIEAALEQHPDIRQAVAVAREDKPEQKELVAYLIARPESAVTCSALRTHLRRTLPEYMIPSAFVQLGVFPLTPNGKVDRRALPAPKVSDFALQQDYRPAITPTETKLVRLWEDVLGISPVGVRTSFFDLGGQSLLAARLFMKISREFGRDLPLAVLFQAPTIEQLARVLDQQSASPLYATLVTIRPHGVKSPFFCVHGGEGNTLFLHRLAREMDSEQPFYGLEPEGLDGRRFSRTTVEQMAMHYLSEIRKVQPKGPYYLGGYCFGGLVAFEMARLLEQQDENAAIIALFSAPLRMQRNQLAPNAVAPPSSKLPPRGSRSLRFLLSPGQAFGWRLRALFSKLENALQEVVCQGLLVLGYPVPQRMRTMYIVRRLNRAEREYIPQKYSGSLLVFRGKGMYEDDPTMGWGGLAGTVTVCEIGDSGLRTRRDIMNEPLVSQVARELTVYIDPSRRGAPERLLAAPVVRSPKPVDYDAQAVQSAPATDSA